MLSGLRSVSVESFPESCSGFAACLYLFFAGTVGRGCGLARKLARGGELARISGGARLHIEHDIFFSRFAGRPRYLLGHAGGVVLQEGELIEKEAQIKGIEILGQGFIGGGASVAEAIQRD